MRTICLAVALSILLLGCGGGSFDEDDAPRAGIQPVGCAARPESCR
jgi:hypothetical protein